MAQQTSSTDPQSQLQKLCRTEQRDLLDQLYNAVGWRKEGDLGVGDEAIAAAHEERTILELIQNARDAIQRASDGDGSPTDNRFGTVTIIVGPEALYVANTGSPFELNDDDVFEAVTALNRSEKAYERGAIGEKGVGMKSILRSAEQFSIHSVVDSEKLSAQFSRSQSTEMLLEVYSELLLDSEFRHELDLEYNSAVVDRIASLIDETVDTSGSSVPSQLKSDFVDRDLDHLRSTPPNPVEVIRDLPRLSLFQYPFIESASGTSSNQDGLTEILLQSTSADQHVWDSFDSDLQSELAEHQSRYRTVIKLEYADTRWRSLLDNFHEPLASTPISDHHPTAAQQFSDQRESAEGADTDNPAEKIWNECDALDSETLILLGAIKHANFLRLQNRETDGQLGIQEARRETVTIDSGSNSSDLDIHRRDITVRTERRFNGNEIEQHHQYREYSQPVEIGVELDEDLDDEEFDEPMRLLFEKPRKDDDQWEPDCHPLYLFYPIDDAETPFPFVIHAPFRVGLDRQELDDTPLNKELLNLVPELITAAAVDLVQSETDDSHNYDTWMPWLVLPLQADADEPVDRVVEATHQALRDTAIIPTYSDEILKPPDVLFDPKWFLAFEPLRTAANESSVPTNDGLPILTKKSVKSATHWFDSNWDPDSGQYEGIRPITEPVGLTTVIDQPFDDSSTSTRGLITVLRDFWGIPQEVATDTISEVDWGVDVNDEEHAKQYFKTICSALDRFAESEDERDDDRDPAQKLGDWLIPLLPAEEHTSVRSAADPEIGYLVRASTRRAGGGTKQYERSDRIVFRRSKPSNQTSIDLLEAPPESLDVYLTPFNEEWTGKLQANYNEWGTRELEGPATYYQRITAEIGGFSDSDEADLEFDGNELGYLVNLYYIVVEKAPGQTPEWLSPVPFHNRQFTASGQHKGVFDFLYKNYLSSLPDDYDTFLERRYSQCVPLPSMNGKDTRAEHLVFGPQWADAFRGVADRLDDEEISDPFTDDADDTANRIANLRRWATAIETAAEYRPEQTPQLAEPSDERWNKILGRLAVPEEDQLGVPEEERDLWILNFLLHAGVQVGPHIEWGWLLPGAGARDRRTGALQLQEVQTLVQGGNDLSEDLPITPTKDELDRYKAICWRSEHHPAFSAGHTSTCRERFVEASSDEWADVAGNDIAIPSWWRFTEFDSIDSENADKIRRSILLMWPELEASMLETGWVCTDTGHYIQSPETLIPTLGLVQLRIEPLWPSIWPTSGSLADTEWRDPYRTDKNQATMLVYDPSDGSGGRNIERELPVIDTEALTEDLGDEIDAFEFTLRELAASLGAKPVDELTPAEAAEQLNWFLGAHEAQGTQAGDNSLSELNTAHDESVRRPALGLLRRFGARDHLRPQIPDENAENQQRWQRRDVWYTGTRLLVNDGGNSKTVAVGCSAGEPTESIAVYTARLPSFARDILEDRNQPFVEVPSNRPGSLAFIFGDSQVESETVTFGIERKSEGEIPELEKAKGASVVDEEQANLEELATEIDDRIPYLIAAFNRVHNTEANLEEVYTQLDQITSNRIGIVDNPTRSSQIRRSAQWQPPDSDDEDRAQIAIFEDVLAETATESIPPYYAADGLLQVIDDKPSQQAREAFENVLMKELRQLERDYQDTIPEIERQITALNTARLRRIHKAVKQLLSHIDSSVAMPTIDWTSVEAREVLETLTKSVSEESEQLDVDSEPLRTWITTLSDSTPLSRTESKRCILAGTSTDRDDTQRLMINAVNQTSTIDLERLAQESEWSALNDWPASSEAQTLKTYLTAVARLREFWAVIIESENPGADIIQDAISSSKQQSAPAAVAETTNVCPRPSDLPDSLQDIPLLAIVERDSEAVPPAFQEAVQRWCDRQKSTVLESDILFEEEDFIDLFNALCAALEDPSESLEIIQSEFRTFGDEGSTTHVDRKNKRKKRTEEWTSEDSPFATLDFSTDDSMKNTTPESGGSPTVGNRSGQAGGYENAEIAADRGRDAELICLERAWEQFKSTSSSQRAEILDVLETWRSFDKWRMKSADNAIATAPTATVRSLNEYSRAKEVLTADEFDDETFARSTFQALFDVAEERGPGFDYIDPFGSDYGSVDSDDWSPTAMRRVEVKAVMPNRAANGRFKLTGNEFRMACRPGPSAAPDLESGREVTTWKYLVRIVLLPKKWDSDAESPNDIEIRDIRDVVRFGNFDHQNEPVWEKLRGGKFYVNFEVS